MKPEWLKVKIPGGERSAFVRRAVRSCNLHTVCEEARCPNRGECWDRGTATFLILGSACTRGCAFCAVERRSPQGQLDESEPRRVAAAVEQMGLDYAVITSVTRDDLADGGASIFTRTVRAIKSLASAPLVELLIPDLQGTQLAEVVSGAPDVLAHNIEVVARLTPGLRHPRFSYARSLEVLAQARDQKRELVTKSSILLGLGETDEEVEQAMADLAARGVDILVLGQYLQPSRSHAPVVEFSPPERFAALAKKGQELGLGFVAASPLARTSYRAAEAFAKSNPEARSKRAAPR